MRRLLFATAAAVALIAGAAFAQTPQTFKSEASATAFCKSGNVVWYNPGSKIYFTSGAQYYGKTKAGGFTCRALAEKAGYRASKGSR